MMKKILFGFLFLAFIGCDSDDQYDGFATCMINGNMFEANDATFSVGSFVDPISNQTLTQTTIEFSGIQGELLILSFEGESTGTYSLTSSGVNNAFYFSNSAIDYKSISGIVFINNYKKENNQTTITGTFEFTSQATIDQSILTATNGNFNVIKNP